MALLVSFAWRFHTSLAAFWVQDAIGVGRFAANMATFLSGLLMPVAFMPPFMPFLAPWAGFGALAPVFALWRVGVRNYTSTRT